MALALCDAMEVMEGVGWNDPMPDRGLRARIYLISGWMMAGSLIVGLAALFRAMNEVLFEDGGNGGRILPLSCGVCGLGLFVVQWMRWGPYTGEDFPMFQGWQFGVAWLLMWGCFVFVRISTDSGDSGRADSNWDPKLR